MLLILNFLMRKALNSTTFSCVQVFIFPALNKLPKKFIRGESVRFLFLGGGHGAYACCKKNIFVEVVLLVSLNFD